MCIYIYIYMYIEREICTHSQTAVSRKQSLKVPVLPTTDEDLCRSRKQLIHPMC